MIDEHLDFNFTIAVITAVVASAAATALDASTFTFIDPHLCSQVRLQKVAMVSVTTAN